MRVLAIVLLLVGPGLAAPAAAMPRLSRAQFDVIAPSARITGPRGAMRIYQFGCRVGPTREARRRIVDIAVQEWAFFGFQTIDARHAETRFLPRGVLSRALNPWRRHPYIERRVVRLGTFEDDEAVAATIAGYWSATPEGAEILARQDAAWNGPGGDAVNWVEPWSAAFVSWVMCEAGLGDMTQFARSISHRVYIDQAIRAHDGRDPDAAYVAYDAGDKPIAPGDLLCHSRAGTDYRDLADRRPDMGAYARTHCDIAVALPRGGRRVLVIGGNVLQSASLTILPLTRAGTRYPRPVSADETGGAQTVFAHLKLRADPIEADALANSHTVKALRALAPIPASAP